MSWTADGDYLAIIIEGDNIRSDIYLLDVSDGQAVNLTLTETVNEYEPAVHPKGKSIVYVSDQRKADEPTRDLYTIGLDGSKSRLLLECQEACSQPEWSPDGKQIVFQMGSDLYLLPAGGGSQPGWWGAV